MVGTSSYWLGQHQSTWESSTFRSCMIAPVEQRQHEILPASIIPCRASANLGLNGLQFSCLSEKGPTLQANGLIGQSAPHYQTPLLNPNGYLTEQRIGVQTSFYKAPCPQQKRFLIFDQSGNETRLVFSSLCPRVQNPTVGQTNCPTNQQIYAEANNVEQARLKAPVVYEDSGENETVDEGSEMPEDTEDIDALLYSDDDGDDNDGFDANYGCEGENDDEVSTGHSPLSMGKDFEKRETLGEGDFDEVDSFNVSSKRLKTREGGHNKIPSSHESVYVGDLICGVGDGVGPTLGIKRPRNDKIRDTLRVLESIVPGMKGKDPLVILDEAIGYLKLLKSNAEAMSMEDLDSSSCYEPLN